MEEGVTRIGVSLPKNLLNEFDSIIRTRGYSSRSEAIRDAIRNYIAEYKWLEREEGE
ncbi:MAG: nickel-responsive transcriptional regulator NikR, partial [Archaeoglobales archaeon]